MCHQGENPQGKLALDGYKSILRGGQSGPVIKPGIPDDSLLVQNISGEKPRMPKVGPQLAPLEIELIRSWISQGAKDDGLTETKVEQETWWSLQPLLHGKIPHVESAWVRTPIDAFVLAKLQEKGLSASS